MSSESEELRFIRLDEVEKHNNENSCWIILHNKVYDVTTFLNEHPPGEDVILEQAGNDATDPFEDAGHSKDAKELLPQYLIGQVHPDDLGNGESKLLNGNIGDDIPWKSWLIPITIGLAVTLAYRYYLASRYTSSSGI